MKKIVLGLFVLVISNCVKAQDDVTTGVFNFNLGYGYADITTAFPDYQPEDAVYEIKVIPTDRAKVNNILVNSSVTLK